MEAHNHMVNQLGPSVSPDTRRLASGTTNKRSNFEVPTDRSSSLGGFFERQCRPMQLFFGFLMDVLTLKSYQIQKKKYIGEGPDG